MTPALRITLRCISEDLGLESADATANDIESIDHEVCRAFIRKRSRSPTGTEKLQPLTTNVEAYTLHAGRWRGATWHDTENNTVWLLGCGMHRSGEREDVYPHLKGLDAKGLLFPVERDYELLFEIQDRAFAEALIHEVPHIIEGARLNPGQELQSAIAGRVQVAVIAERAEQVQTLWLAVSMSPRPGDTQIPKEWLTILLAAFFPEVRDPLTALHASEELPTRSKKDDELIFVEYRD